MVMKARPYQDDLIEASTTELHARRNTLTVCPTGGGKTFIAKEIIERGGFRNTLFLAHRKDLVHQTHKRFSEFLDVGKIISGTNFTAAPHQVASIQTLSSRIKRGGMGHLKPDLIIIDECHRSRGGQYDTLLKSMPDVPVLGITATPCRLDGKGLGDIFEEMIIGPSAARLAEQGYLVMPRVFAANAPSSKGVRKTGGDFNQKQAAEAMMSDDGLIGNIVDHWAQHCRNRRTILFAQSVAHMEQLAERLTQAGARCHLVTGDTPTEERDRIYARISRRRGEILLNVGVAWEGLDIPQLDACIMARMTQSVMIHLQSIGRIMRTFQGKHDAILLDHAGNCMRMFLPWQEVEWSLDHTAAPVVKDTTKNTSKVCQGCFAINDVKETHCVVCGAKFGRETQTFEEKAGELGEIKIKKVEVPYEVRARAWIDLRAEQLRKNYQISWAFVRYKTRFGHWPAIASGRLIDPDNHTEEESAEYLAFLKGEAVRLGKKPGWAYAVWRNALAKQARTK